LRQPERQRYELDPANPMVLNNLKLLNSSYRYVQRTPGQP